LSFHAELPFFLSTLFFPNRLPSLFAMTALANRGVGFILAGAKADRFPSFSSSISTFFPAFLSIRLRVSVSASLGSAGVSNFSVFESVGTIPDSLRRFRSSFSSAQPAKPSILNRDGAERACYERPLIPPALVSDSFRSLQTRRAVFPPLPQLVHEAFSSFAAPLFLFVGLLSDLPRSPTLGRATIFRLTSSSPPIFFAIDRAALIVSQASHCSLFYLC